MNINGMGSPIERNPPIEPTNVKPPKERVGPLPTLSNPTVCKAPEIITGTDRISKGFGHVINALLKAVLVVLTVAIVMPILKLISVVGSIATAISPKLNEKSHTDDLQRMKTAIKLMSISIVDDFIFIATGKEDTLLNKALL